MTTVTVGSTIEIELDGKDGKKEMKIEIRKGESKPTEGIISTNAPLAKALLNGKEGPAQEGDERGFSVGTRINKVRVLKIYP